MTIEGKIFEILTGNPKVIDIVIRKKKGDKYYPISFVAFGKVKDDVITLGLEKTDKIRISYYLQSRKWNDKYYTSAVIEGIDLLERFNKVQTQVKFVDRETGEIIE